MTLLKLKPQKVTPEILDFLEKKGLIRTLKPTSKPINVKQGSCMVNILYSTAPKYGTHKLIEVGMNLTGIKLNFHPDNEEFIIVGRGSHKFKPLYLVIGTENYKKLEKKAKNNTLDENDILVLEMKYNDFKTCVFTMLKNTPHCEVTLSGSRQAPIFFVTEPTKLKLNYLDLHNYKLILK